jgi:hypothetical protein
MNSPKNTPEPNFIIETLQPKIVIDDKVLI